MAYTPRKSTVSPSRARGHFALNKGQAMAQILDTLSTEEEEDDLSTQQRVRRTKGARNLNGRAKMLTKYNSVRKSRYARIYERHKGGFSVVTAECMAIVVTNMQALDVLTYPKCQKTKRLKRNGQTQQGIQKL